MIGQHIYSRCLEGYFSKSGVNADSTTVTISMDMFARADQAQTIARQCERISTLEDMRPVPSSVQGAYRGVLKIRRLNRQITMVCRAYRLHSEQGNGAGGESRDFTYASSYLLTGDDKARFLQSPEYCLNIQDFEPYPSIMNRIQESRRMGRNGRIEASTRYSLFHNTCRTAPADLFVQAGFTKELFIDYISSIIQKVSYAHYEGHENDKVLLVLPRQFNPAWEQSGGNAYAEEILAATIRLLPQCVAEQLSASTGGMHDPGAFVLEGYQLVFMEPGNTREWRRSEYSVIDLDQQVSYVSNGLDRTYGEFLWNHLADEAGRGEFEALYAGFFDKEGEQDHSPEKFSLVLNMLKEKDNGFADISKRKDLLSNILELCRDHWSEPAKNIARILLESEIQTPGYEKRMEQALYHAVKNPNYPAELKPAAAAILMQDILNGEADETSILWITEQIQRNDPAVKQTVSEVNRYVEANTDVLWTDRKSLMEFYRSICRNTEIPEGEKVKTEILSILGSWYQAFLERQDWRNSAAVVKILAEQLENPGLGTDRRTEVYQDLIYLLFFMDAGQEVSAGRSEISDLIKNEERTFGNAPQKLKIFQSCFRRQLSAADMEVNRDVIWQMTYLAIAGSRDYLNTEWKDAYGELVRKSAALSDRKFFADIHEHFSGWIQNIGIPEKLDQIYEAIGISEQMNLEAGMPFYMPEMTELRKITDLLIGNGRARQAADLLYRRYSGNPDKEFQTRMYREMTEGEKWLMFLSWGFFGDPGRLLERARKGQLPKSHGEYLAAAALFGLKEGEAEIAAEVYLEICQKDIDEKQKNMGLMAAWCDLIRKEYTAVRTVSDPFAVRVIDGIRKRMAQSEPESLTFMSVGDVQFLRESGILSLGEGTEHVDIISELYALDEGSNSDEFMLLRSKISGCDVRVLKAVYLDALGKKRVQLTEVGSRGELLYNIVLLEEQVNQDLTGTDSLSLDKVTDNIYGNASARDRIMTAMGLLYVIDAAGNQWSHGIYNTGYVRDQLLKEFRRMSNVKAAALEDAQLAQMYRKLSRETKEQMNRVGFDKALGELSSDWQNKYGIREESSRAELIIPGITAGVMLLLGIGLVVLFTLMYESIGVQTSLIVGVVLAAVGLIGDLVVMILMLLSMNR